MHFRVHKMKPGARETFRWSPHTGGQAVVKPRDYELAGEVEAPSDYAAWKLLNERGEPLLPGDVLEIAADAVDGAALAENTLRIVKYIGFEPAAWWVAPQKPLSNDDNVLNSAPNSV